jgi:hypothetical protein
MHSPRTPGAGFTGANTSIELGSEIGASIAGAGSPTQLPLAPSDGHGTADRAQARVGRAWQASDDDAAMDPGALRKEGALSHWCGVIGCTEAACEVAEKAASTARALHQMPMLNV